MTKAVAVAVESDISDLSFNTGFENMSEVDEGEVNDGTSDRPSGNTDDFKQFVDVLMGMEKRLNLRIANLESKFQTTIKNRIIDQLSLVEQKLNASMQQIEQSIDRKIDAKIEERVNERIKQGVKDEIKDKILEKQWEVNRLEQYTRKWNVRVYGINEKGNEDCKKEVVKFAENKLGLQNSRKDINIAHGVGRKLRSKTRAQIVRFHSHEKKTSFVKAKGVLRDTTSQTQAYRKTLRT